MQLKFNQILMQILVIGLIINWITPGKAFSANTDELHTQAENCYKALIKDVKKQRYRERWLYCIAKYESVYRLDPNGPRAAQSLFMSGALYQALYKRSGRLKDKKEAVDIFERVLKRYPQSAYRTKATAALRELATTGPKSGTTLAAKTAPSVLKKTAAKDSPKHKTNQYPKPAGDTTASKPKTTTPKKPTDSTITVTKLPADEKPRAVDDKKAAKKPSTTDPADSRKKGLKKDDQPASQPQKDTNGAAADKTITAKKDTKAEPAITVTGLRYWSNPHYTRVVIDADAETIYKHKLLKKDPALKKPKRLYIDLKGSRLGPGIKKTIPINDDLLIDARAGQYLVDTVRVVIDIKSYQAYNIFPLKNPFRIVVDIRGEEPKKPPPLKKAIPKHPPKKGEPSISPGALAKQLSLGVKTVVIDPGHGGRDYGAPGYYKGTHEKYVVLQIARRLAAKIRKELKFNVHLTRNSDRYLTLEERTAIANTKNADLFISIHTNSHQDRRAYGIETYILNLAKDDESIRVAAFENATSEKNISDLQTILSDLMQNAKIDESTRLAGYVQNSLSNNLKKRYSKVRNKGVKQAPFYVLLGAGMPSILIETSFISNPRECKRLRSAQYQEYLCDGIVNGIRKYVRELKPI